MISMEDKQNLLLKSLSTDGYIEESAEASGEAIKTLVKRCGRLGGDIKILHKIIEELRAKIKELEDKPPVEE